MHACRCRAIDTRMYFYIHTYAHARGDGCREPQMEPPMRVCASGHPYTPRGTSVDTDARCTDGHTTLARAHAHMRTLPWNMVHARSYTYMHSHIHTYVDVWGARLECRFRHARARTCAHALAWNRHVHPYACTCTHTYTYTHGDTHLSGCAVVLPRCSRAHARTFMQTRAPTRTLECMLRAHAYIHTCAQTYAEIYGPSDRSVYIEFMYI
jgi:hypothetical protein